MTAIRVWAVPLVLLAGCGSEAAEVASPRVPPMKLAPGYPALRQIAGEAPPEPDAAAQSEMRQLWEALDAGGRLAAMAERDLREQPGASWFLPQHLADPDEQHRIRAAWLLGEIGDPLSSLPLLLRCKDEANATVRLWLANALWRVGNDSMLLDLVQSMNRPELANDAGRMAIELLQSAGSDAGESPTYVFLQDGVRQVYRHWREHGEAQRKPDWPRPDAASFQAPLARLLLAVSEHNLRYADEARYILGSSGVIGLPLLRLCLGAEERDLRDTALQTAIVLGPVAADLVPATLPLLGDPLLAPTAVRALGEMRAAEALPYVRPLLDSPNLEMRCVAAGALGLLGDRADIARLQQLQDDETQPIDVRVQAAFSLAVFEAEHPARRFLLELRRDGRFHQGRLDLMLERLQRLDEISALPR